MKPLLALTLLASLFPLRAREPGAASTLPLTGSRIVQVGTEPQLQAAMGSLRAGDTILLSNGVYRLTTSLYINSKSDVTIRGASGSTNVVLEGQGMDNPGNGRVPFGIWSNSRNTTVAHLTIRETYDNPLIFNPGAQSPHIYNVRLINAGSQFIKSNPTDVASGSGVNDGVVEFSGFEYTDRPPLDHGAGVGYFNGISAHAAKNWIVRHNLFKNLHNPDGTAYPWNPAVLFWRHSSGTVTEQNTFINVDRAVAYGLENTVPYPDHSGGAVRNNFVELDPGLFSASRRASSDGAIIAWNSPGTQVDHNTLLLHGNTAYAIEFRFPATTGATARNNLADAGIHRRDQAQAAISGNTTAVRDDWFAQPLVGDLHLLRPAALNLSPVPSIPSVPDDFDGDARSGSHVEPGADEVSFSAPVILGVELSATNLVLRFTSDPGATYDLERSSAIGNPDWTVAAASIPGTGSIMETQDPDPPAEPHRFYRIREIL